jgi:hypothetical protein
MGVEIRMETGQVVDAVSVAALRRMASRSAGLKHKYGAQDEDGWAMDCEGACAELAASLATGVPWQRGVNTFKREGDVGPYEVRHSTTHGHRLILREGDPDERAYILVTGQAPNMVVHGWITGAEGKRIGEWKGPNGRALACFVAARLLRPIETLPELDWYREHAH